jgi:hypothetical protein
MKTFRALLWLALGLCIASLIFLFVSPRSAPTAGTTLPGGTALFETSLASRITSSDTSMTLAANSVGGTSISGYNCFTLDEGRTDAEFVCGTVSGTSVTALERGISFTTGTTTSASLQKAHRVGANVKITDYPLIQRMKAQLNGEDTIPNIISYTWSPNFTSAASSTFTSKGYVDGLVIAGAPNATEAVQGIVELATGKEAASSTQIGATGANLGLWAKYATDTPQNCTLASPCVPFTDTAGKIAAAFIKVAATYAWTALHTFSGGLTSTGTTTISASNLFTNPLVLNGLAYKWPSVRAASSTFPMQDASGNIVFVTGIASSTQILYHNTAALVQLTAATSSLVSVTIPAGSLNRNSTLRISATVAGRVNTGASPNAAIVMGDGSSSSTIGFISAVGFTNAFAELVSTVHATSTSAQVTGAHAIRAGDPIPVASFSFTSSAYYTRINTTFNTANQLYITFDANAGATGNWIQFDDALVELIN